MAELPDLLEMAFPDFKIPRNIILGFTKLVYGINYGLKFFFRNVWDWWKLQIIFTVCLKNLLNDVSNCKQLDTHILYYDKISSCMEKPYIGSSCMGHVDAETMEILKEDLKILRH